MRLGVWGAGEVGTATVYRLASTAFTAEIHWINRSLEKIECRVVDIEQGLALAPRCTKIGALAMQQARRVLREMDLLVLTLGDRVHGDLRREDLYAANRKIFREHVLPALKDCPAIILVVSNPVDLLTRLLVAEAGLSPRKVMGLGTVVETARLQASLGSYLTPRRAARGVDAYVVGTHDDRCVAVVPAGGNVSRAGLDPEVIEYARKEVIRGAARVKRDERPTLFPIVEGVVAVAKAIADDSRATLSVSVLDPSSTAHLCYSMPCSLGKAGVLERRTECLADVDVKTKLDTCERALAKVLRGNGELQPPS